MAELDHFTRLLEQRADSLQPIQQELLVCCPVERLLAVESPDWHLRLPLEDTLDLEFIYFFVSGFLMFFCGSVFVCFFNFKSGLRTWNSQGLGLWLV